MPYKYVVSVASKSFEEAPECVLRALSRLSWATEKAVMDTGGHYLPPNELLLLGYFENMRIGVRFNSFLATLILLSHTNFFTSTMMMAKALLGQQSPPCLSVQSQP